MKLFPISISLLVVALVSGCSSESGSSAAKGNPPTISNLSFETQSIPVGKVETVKGSVDFDDADGDFDAIEGELVFASQKQTIPRYPATTNGQKKGTLQLLFQLGAAQAGTADIQLWGVDKNGNKSNVEKISLEAK